MGPGASLDRCGKSRPTGIRSPDLAARSESLYRLSYPGSNLGDCGGIFQERLWKIAKKVILGYWCLKRNLKQAIVEYKPEPL